MKTVTVVIVAGWGIYTFIYKDILLPNRAPAALIVEVGPLAKEETGSATSAGGKRDGRRALNLRITATNPTKRQLFLLPSVWWLWGLERQPAEPEAFEEAAKSALQYGGIQHAERGSQIQGTPVLATGSLFVDNRIQPGEKITRDLPIGLPVELNNFAVNQLELVLIVPLLTRNPNAAPAFKKLFGGRRINWNYSEQVDVHPVLCNARNQCQAIDQEELRNQVSQFDPDALIFQQIVIVGERP